MCTIKEEGAASDCFIDFVKIARVRETSVPGQYSVREIWHIICIRISIDNFLKGLYTSDHNTSIPSLSYQKASSQGAEIKISPESETQSQA
jgi:hypothetical protein